MKIIDVDTWNRKHVYRNFMAYTNPSFSISVRIDVTKLCRFCKEQHRSFFAEFLFYVMRTVNAIDEFKLRILGEQVVQYDMIYPSYIVMLEDGSISTCCTMVPPEHEHFCQAVKADIAAARNGNIKDFNYEKNTNDCVYISCLPWTDICGMSNPYHYADQEQTSIPRITWGKFTQEDEKNMMFLDIACHHALMDGEAVCRAINMLQTMINEIN